MAYPLLQLFPCQGIVSVLDRRLVNVERKEVQCKSVLAPWQRQMRAAENSARLGIMLKIGG